MTSESLNPLINDDRLEFEGHNGIRSLCHLIVFYLAGGGPRVCVVGNFDSPVGAQTTNAIESAATAVADWLGQDDFRLFEWYPHRPGEPFSEVTLRRVAPQTLLYGQLLVVDSPEADTSQQRVTVRFVDPQWARRTEDHLAELLGEPSIRELRSYAGIRGDYHPERLFGTTGRRKLNGIRDHNRQTVDQLEAQISESTTGPP
jgi:hypothetical protein